LYLGIRFSEGKISLFSEDKNHPQNYNFNIPLQAILHFFPDSESQIFAQSMSQLVIPSQMKLPNLSAQIANGSLVGNNYSLEEILSSYLVAKRIIPLLPFQIEGVNFLLKNKRVLLADDMGLGKTIQALGAISKLISDGEITRTLIICPRSLVFNWYQEIKKWIPHITATAVMPSGSAAESVWKSRTGRSQIIITSYEQLRLGPQNLAGQAQLVVCDEAHKLRNHDSQLSKSFRTLKPDYLWFLTGTPVERDAVDFSTLFSLLLPRQFSIEDSKLGLELLKMRAQPFFLRRRKSDVLTELPPMIEKKEYIELLPSQRKEYLNILRSREDSILVKFSKLRRVCDISSEDGASSKLDRVMDLLEEIHLLGEKAVIFSFWRKPLFKLGEMIVDAGIGNLDYLVSEMSLSERDQAVTNFKINSDFLLASGKIAAEGLTLTEATHAIFINRWWNPSANEQARDRIRRIGQTKTTYMYEFIAIDTVEERMEEILEDKEATTEDLVNAMATYLQVKS